MNAVAVALNPVQELFKIVTTINGNCGPLPLVNSREEMIKGGIYVFVSIDGGDTGVPSATVVLDASRHSMKMDVYRMLDERLKPLFPPGVTVSVGLTDRREAKRVDYFSLDLKQAHMPSWKCAS